MWRVKNALAAGCSKTHFHLMCVWVRIQGYKALRYYSKINTKSLWIQPALFFLSLIQLDLSFCVKENRLLGFLWLFTILSKTISLFLFIQWAPAPIFIQHRQNIMFYVLSHYFSDSLSIVFCHTHRTQRVGVFWIVIWGVKGVQI